MEPTPSEAEATPRSSPEESSPEAGEKFRAKRRTVGLAVGVGLLTLALYSGAIQCPVARFAHVPCPGCGSTRAVWAVAHGDVHEWLRMNPLGPIVALLLGVVVVLTFWHSFTRGTTSGALDGRVGRAAVRGLLWAFALEVLVWGIRWFGLLGRPVPV